MKKISVVIAALCVTGLLAGCGSTAAPAATPEPTVSVPASTAPAYDKSELMLSEFNDTEVSTDVLLSSGEPITGQEEEITLSYQNNSDRDFTYTALQRLEVQLDGEWYMVPDAQDFVTMQLFTVPANGTVEQNFRFADRYEPLPIGQYRIVKSFVDRDGNNVLGALEFQVG